MGTGHGVSSWVAVEGGAPSSPAGLTAEANRPPPTTAEAGAEGDACTCLALAAAAAGPQHTNTGQAVAEGSACSGLTASADRPQHGANAGQAVAEGAVPLELTASATGPRPTYAGQAVAEGAVSPGLVDSGTSVRRRHVLTVTRPQAMSENAESNTPAVRAEAWLLRKGWRLHPLSWPPAALIPEGVIQVHAQVAGSSGAGVGQVWRGLRVHICGAGMAGFVCACLCWCGAGMAGFICVCTLVGAACLITLLDRWGRA